MKAPKEKLLYIPCIYRDTPIPAPDYIATVDMDESSPTYSKIIHRLEMPNMNDELHHTGWNACSSCYHDPSKRRRLLISPGLVSSRLYAVDVESNPRAPRIEKIVEPEVMNHLGLANPHTVHCIPGNQIMISTIGTPDGDGKASRLEKVSGHLEKKCCSQLQTGPGYASPIDAMKAPKEKLLYIPCIYRNTPIPAPDYIATVDMDESSPTYSKIIHRLEMPNMNDELHHTGWNACSSCYHDPSKRRRLLISPG